MPEFKKYGRPAPGGPRRSFGSRPAAREGERFDADCNNCGAKCQVPFRPNGKKPVYCRDCFTPTDDRAPQSRFAKRDSFAPRTAAPREDRSMADLARQLERMNATLEALAAAVDALAAAQPAKRATVKKSAKS